MRSLRGWFVPAMLCIATVISAQEVAPGVHFTGQILVSVRGEYTHEGPAAGPASSGWTIEPLATVRPAPSDLESPGSGEPKTWLLLTPPSITEAPAPAGTTHPWDASHRFVAAMIGDETNELPLPLDTDRIIEIEPVAGYEARGYSDRIGDAMGKSSSLVCDDAPAGFVIACGPASFQWPNVTRVSWHQDDDRTQLRKARARAEPHFQKPEVVRIAHLDTGYYTTNDSITPPRFDFSLSRSLIPNDQCGPTGIDCYRGGLPNGHGPETLSVLAGGKVHFAGGEGYPAYDDYIGGAPLAVVFTYRVSPSVALIFPLYVAEGIFGAIENEADVISMSMGGAPSYYLRDAVNAAYDSGVPMFFAAADFFRLPVPIIPITIPPPTMVYPARFNTATPVSGMTAAGRSYALNPSWFLSVLRGNALSWMLRGSFGPRDLMQDRALTAFSPNITSRHGTVASVANQIQFGFSGTSAATPQAAAAAALWLQVHRDEFDDEEWRSWVKTQSAYDALVRSAQLPHGDVLHFGAGVLQADRALDLPRPADPVKRKKGEIGFDWITLLVTILGIDPNDPPPTGKRAELHRDMLKLEVAQLVTTEPSLRDILNGDFENTPSRAQLERLARAIQRHPRASRHLQKSVKR